MKILYIGNSITRHGPAAELGWHGDWGMAASCAEADYVHRLNDLLRKAGKHIVPVIRTLVCIETQKDKPADWSELTSENPDLVIIRLGENSDAKTRARFLADYRDIVRAFQAQTPAPVILSVGTFWENAELEKAMKKNASLLGIPYVDLSDIRSDEYRAIKQFKHEGVAAHPSDKGMDASAKRIFDCIDSLGLLAPAAPLRIPKGEPKSEDYKIRLNGKPADCWPCRVSAMSFNRVWPGHQRTLDQTELASFVSFDMTAPVDVAVTLDHTPSEVVIRPLSKGVIPEVKGKTVYFTVREPGAFSLEADGRHRNLHIFANPAPDWGSAPETATYSFGPGTHEIGRLHLKTGDSVYIAAGAVVYGELSAKDAEHIRVFGRGILDGSRVDRSLVMRDDMENDGMIHFVRCRDVVMDGVILRDSAMWTMTAINCVGMDLRNIRVIGMWRYNTDGFDFVNSQNIRVSDCFLRTFDDTIVLKGLCLGDRTVEKMNLYNIIIERCVLWCDWGGALEIGAETVADEYANIIFRECDIIRNDFGAMRIHSGDRALIHNVLYEHIRVEYTKYDRECVYQATEKMKYNPSDTPNCPYVIRNWMYCGRWSPDNIPGHVEDIIYRDIRVLTDPEVQPPRVLLEGADEEHRIDRLSVCGYTLNGKPVSPQIDWNAHVRNISVSPQADKD